MEIRENRIRIDNNAERHINSLKTMVNSITTEYKHLNQKRQHAINPKKTNSQNAI
jgi:hypothetical protein